jgi:hypothetical protein
MDLRTTQLKQLTNKFMEKFKKQFKTPSGNIIVWIKICNYIEFRVIRFIRVIDHKSRPRTLDYKFTWTEPEPETRIER